MKQLWLLVGIVALSLGTPIEARDRPDIPAPVDTSRLPRADRPARIDLRIENDSRIYDGRNFFGVGMLCLRGNSVEWVGGAPFFKTSFYEDTTALQFRELGFDLRTEPHDNLAGRRANYLIVGRVTSFDANICLRDIGFGNDRRGRGYAIFEIEWTIFQPGFEAPLARFSTRGGFAQRRSSDFGVADIVARAYLENVRQLLVSEGFENVAEGVVQS